MRSITLRYKRYALLVHNVAMIADPLNGVTTFLAVAETSSFTAAAGRLGVTPTAVCKTIRLREARHGVMLFQRTTRRRSRKQAMQFLCACDRPPRKFPRRSRDLADSATGRWAPCE